jgi:hypothetical protein
VFGNHRQVNQTELVPTCHETSTVVQSPPAMTHGGGSWRSGSAATSMPGQGCHTTFFICTHCDRGHRYCSPECRDQARRRQRRSANKRHQQSPEERLDHRDRQQAYRCRLRQAPSPVTDQGSLLVVSPASFDCGKADAVKHPPASQSWHESQPALWLRCRICGRAGRFIDPFPHIPHRR